MANREQEKTREKLNKDLELTLDKEQLRELDPKTEGQEQVRGGGCGTRTCGFSI